MKYFKPPTISLVAINLSIVLFVVEQAHCQNYDYNTYQKNPNYNAQAYNGQAYNAPAYNAPAYNDRFPDYDVENYNGVPVEDAEEKECYSCAFQLRRGHLSGHDNCRDPFIKDDIARATCKGPCAKIYTKTSETDYSIVRICMPNCKSLMDEVGYTQCCDEHLCNGAGADQLTIPTRWLIFTTAIAFLLSSHWIVR